VNPTAQEMMIKAIAIGTLSMVAEGVRSRSGLNTLFDAYPK
jgi:hypothetical protein